MRILYESPQPPAKVEIDYHIGQAEHQCYGVSTSLPEPGDQIQSFGGPRFVLIQVESLGYSGAFCGVCKALDT